MIRNVKVKSGFAAELPALKTPFTFISGVNVLFGPNGCGKSTLLRIMAGHTGRDTTNLHFSGGWSKCPSRPIGHHGEIQFPRDFYKNTYGQCAALMGWDGMPVLFNSANLSDGQPMSFCGREDSPDGITGEMEQAYQCMSHNSEGETRLINLARVIKAARKVKMLVPPKEPSPTEQAYFHYLSRIRPKNESPLTLLWDEPDRSLDIIHQFQFWTTFIPRIYVEGIQVIITSHSIVLALLPKYKWLQIVTLKDNYIEDCCSTLKKAFRWKPEDTLPEMRRHLAAEAEAAEAAEAAE